MKKERDGVKEIEKICKNILKLQDEDFVLIDEIVQDQCNYSHPLKMATVRQQHDLGEYNDRVMVALKNLQEVLKSGATICK